MCYTKEKLSLEGENCYKGLFNKSVLWAVDCIVWM